MNNTLLSDHNLSVPVLAEPNAISTAPLTRTETESGEVRESILELPNGEASDSRGAQKPFPKQQVHRVAQILRIAGKIEKIKDPRAARYFALWLRIINKEAPLQPQPLTCPNCGSFDNTYLDENLYCEECRITYIRKNGGLEAI